MWQQCLVVVGSLVGRVPADGPGSGGDGGGCRSGGDGDGGGGGGSSNGDDGGGGGGGGPGGQIVTGVPGRELGGGQ